MVPSNCSFSNRYVGVWKEDPSTVLPPLLHHPILFLLKRASSVGATHFGTFTTGVPVCSYVRTGSCITYRIPYEKGRNQILCTRYARTGMREKCTYTAPRQTVDGTIFILRYLNVCSLYDVLNVSGTAFEGN